MNYISPKLTFLISIVSVIGYVAFSNSFALEKESQPEKIVAPKQADVKKGSSTKKVSLKTTPKTEKEKSVDQQISSTQEVMKNARDRLMRYRSIRADIKETVMFGDRQFQATGSYLQGKNLHLRLEFSVIINQRLKGTLFQVCDGDILWTHTKIGEKQQVTRRVVRDILKAAVAADGKLSENILTAQLGLGGLPALLAALEENMLLNEMKEEKIAGVDFIVVQGRWNDKFLKLWQEAAPGRKENKQISTDPIPLPSRVPDRVRVYLEKKTLFPQRILYLKKHKTKERFKQMVLLDFINVKFNTPINEEDFHFDPPEGVPQKQDTHKYLELLRARKNQ